MSREEVEELFHKYRAGQLNSEEELEFRIAVQGHPELLSRLTQYDRQMEDLMLDTFSQPDNKSKKVLSEGKFFLDIAPQTKDSTNFPIFNPSTSTSEILPLIPAEILNTKKPYKNIRVQLIEKTEEVETLLIHLKDYMPPESHSDIIEQFLVLQGHCTLNMGDQVITKKEGDYLKVPLFTLHDVQVTSSEPCVFVCQRITA